MKVTGSEILGMVKASSVIPMVTLISATSGWAKLMAKVSIPGLMVKYTTANGNRALNMDMESGVACQVTRISESGTRAKLMGTVFTRGRTGIDTKGSGRCA